MISMSDILTLQQRRVMHGRACTEDDSETSLLAAQSLVSHLNHLRGLIDRELACVVPQSSPELLAALPVEEPDLEWCQRYADATGLTVLVLNRIYSVIDQKPRQVSLYLVEQSAATDWERHNAIATITPQEQDHE